MFKLIDAISLAGGDRNEDYYRITDSTILLMDGSTGLSKDAPDAVWFVTRFSELFFEQMDKTDDLCLSVNTATLQLFKEFLQGNDAVSDDFVYPSASLLAMHAKDDKLELITIGDCTAVFFEEGCEIPSVIIHSEQVDNFDRAVIEHMKEIRQNTGDDILNIIKTPAIRAHLIENRKKMNAPEGYEILSFNMRPRGTEDLIILDKSRFSAIHLFSDGFDCIKKQLYRQSCPPLKVLYDILRSIEKEDKVLNKIPRFKPSDDASALKVKLI